MALYKLSREVSNRVADFPPGVSCIVKTQNRIPDLIIFLVVVVLGVFSGSHGAAAQYKAEAPPLRLTTEGRMELDKSCKAGEGLIVQLRYTGEKPLRGYVLRFENAGSATGKPLNDEILEEMRGLREPMILSGQAWSRIICNVPKKKLGDPTTLSAKIDVLKFEDGSIWGPAELRESHQLIGKLDGMDFIEKATELKKFVSPILPEQGPLPGGKVESQTIGPLKFDSGIWRDERGQDKLAVEVTNEAYAPVRGYLFTTTFFDPQSEVTFVECPPKSSKRRGTRLDT